MAKGDLNTQPEQTGFEQAWQAVRADADIQFAPVPPAPVEPPPQWWLDVLTFLERMAASLSGPLSALGPVARIVALALAAVAIAILAIVLWRKYAPRRQAAAPQDESERWSPHAADARALLEQADRLAAAGDYDEATHLLLRRAISQIDAALPGVVDLSSTAREIGAAGALPAAARAAFATIAERVERSLFALRRLEAEDWRVARAAYANFALPGAAP